MQFERIGLYKAMQTSREGLRVSNASLWVMEEQSSVAYGEAGSKQHVKMAAFLAVWESRTQAVSQSAQGAVKEHSHAVEKRTNNNCVSPVGRTVHPHSVRDQEVNLSPFPIAT